jgi:hypothetical protein
LKFSYSHCLHRCQMFTLGIFQVLFCLTSTLPGYISSGYESASLLQTLDIRSHYWELTSIDFHRAVPRREHASTVLVEDHSTAFTFRTTSTISLDPSLLHKFFFLQLSTTSSFLYCRASRVISTPLIQCSSLQGLRCGVSINSRYISDNTSLSHLHKTQHKDQSLHFYYHPTTSLSFFLFSISFSRGSPNASHNHEVECLHLTINTTLPLTFLHAKEPDTHLESLQKDTTIINASTRARHTTKHRNNAYELGCRC